MLSFPSLEKTNDQGKKKSKKKLKIKNPPFSWLFFLSIFFGKKYMRAGSVKMKKVQKSQKYAALIYTFIYKKLKQTALLLFCVFILWLKKRENDGAH